MKAFSNYAETETRRPKEQLPIGGYILEILGVQYENGTNGYSDKLILSFDIVDDAFAGFYRRNYKAQTGEDKKWKGTYQLWVPADDGSERDSWTKSKFKTVMEAFEESNEGFTWEWDENKLKGLRIGGVFNRKEYDFNGRHGFYTRCKYLTTVKSITEGTYSQPDDDYLNNNAPAADDGFMGIPEDIENELPFS